MNDKILKDLKNVRKVVSIFVDRNNKEKCCTGYLSYFDDEGIIINYITSGGEFDGYGWRKKDDIYRIDVNGKYEEKLQLLYNLKKQKNINIELENKSGYLKSLIDFAFLNKEVVEISVDELDEQESIIGIIKEILEDDIMSITQIDEFGEKNGISYIYISDIIKLDCGGVDLSDRKLFLDKK